MRIAVIDLGTNTFNLSVAEKQGNEFVTILGDKEGVGLGLGGINSGLITDDAIARGLDTLRRFKSLAEKNGVTKFVLVGTSALRNAENRQTFLDIVWRELKLKIHVIPGAEEAALIYAGVTSVRKPEHKALIMDIGGGSTEFIYADASGPIKSRSFEIGVSRIYQMFRLSDPLSEKDGQLIEDYLNTSCGDFFDDVQARELIGASGTFETFYELCFNRRYPERKTTSMNREEMLPHLDSVINSTQAERNKNQWIIPIRKKMAPIAAVKIQWIMRKLDIETVTISPFSLKEGVLQNLDKYVE
jgi:exopolyphosphatase/guanosine-5'-triphosphate,3'-diphosphate pyrophosphatase